MPPARPGADKPNNTFVGAFRTDVAYPAEIVPPPKQFEIRGHPGTIYKDLGLASTLNDPFWPDNPAGLPRKSRFHMTSAFTNDCPQLDENKLAWWHAPHSYYNPSPLKIPSFRADGGDDPFKRSLGTFDKERCQKLAARSSSDPKYRKTLDKQWKRVMRGEGDVWKDHDE